MPANQQNIPELSISVNGAGGTLLASSSGKGETYLVYEPEYRPGDCLCVTTEAADQLLILNWMMPCLPHMFTAKVPLLRFPFPSERPGKCILSVLSQAPVIIFMSAWHGQKKLPPGKIWP